MTTWDIRVGNSDLDDDSTSLLAEEEVVGVKSEGITPLSLTGNTSRDYKQRSGCGIKSGSRSNKLCLLKSCVVALKSIACV